MLSRMLTRSQMALLCLGLFLALALCGAWQAFAWGRTQLDTGALVCADTLRLHIRPENDSIASQSAKLHVRDAVLAYLDAACPAKSKPDALCWAARHLFELQLKQMPRRPAKGVRLAFGRAGGVQIGQHGVSHMELCALAGDGIVLGPDVQPQGVGAHQRSGVQLGAAPCKCLPCAAQGKGEKQAKAEQSHLGACKHSG